MISEDDALKQLELILEDGCKHIPSELSRESREVRPKVPATSRKPSLEDYDSR